MTSAALPGASQPADVQGFQTQDTSVVSSTELYTEAGAAPGWQGAKSENIGSI